MTFWIRNIYPNPLGLGLGPSESVHTSHDTRKAKESGRGPTKARRYSYDAYRGVPYRTSDPWRHFRVGSTYPGASSVSEVKGRQKIDKLDAMIRTLPDEEVQQLSGELENRSNVMNARKLDCLRTANIKATQIIPKSQQALRQVAVSTPPCDMGSSTQPNKHASDVATSTSNSKRAILGDMQDPEYVLCDVEIRDGLWHLMNLMDRLAQRYFAFDVHQHNNTIPESFFNQISPETAKIIGCIASVGPGGVQGWHNLFLDEQKRRALVMAIVGNVLVEQVFRHIFFGGIAKHIRRLTELQKEHKNEDGFDRNAHYAIHIRSILDPNKSGHLSLPANFANHVNFIVGVVYTHIKPILTLNVKTDFTGAKLIHALHTLVTQAGILSLSMRIDPHTVYHFEPVFKQDKFDSKRMKCYNRKAMEQENPRTPDTEPLLTEDERKLRATISEAEKKRARNHDPLTQITILDGVTAYRLGGWECAESTILDVKFEKKEFINQGVRARVLTRGWVYCRWGRARRFRDRKGVDVLEAHGTAWRDGEFTEFSDVWGVVDWFDNERKQGKAKLHGKKEAVEAEPSVSRHYSALGLSRRMRMMQEADLQAQLNEEYSY